MIDDSQHLKERFFSSLFLSSTNLKDFVKRISYRKRNKEEERKVFSFNIYANATIKFWQMIINACINSFKKIFKD